MHGTECVVHDENAATREAAVAGLPQTQARRCRMGQDADGTDERVALRPSSRTRRRRPARSSTRSPRNLPHPASRIPRRPPALPEPPLHPAVCTSLTFSPAPAQPHRSTPAPPPSPPTLCCSNAAARVASRSSRVPAKKPLASPRRALDHPPSAAEPASQGAHRRQRAQQAPDESRIHPHTGCRDGSPVQDRTPRYTTLPPPPTPPPRAASAPRASCDEWRRGVPGGAGRGGALSSDAPNDGRGARRLLPGPERENDAVREASAPNTRIARRLRDRSRGLDRRLAIAARASSRVPARLQRPAKRTLTTA